MKVGDLVKATRSQVNKIGVIIENVGHNKGVGCSNKVFKVLWLNGIIGNNVWDYDLKVVNESR